MRNPADRVFAGAFRHLALTSAVITVMASITTTAAAVSTPGQRVWAARYDGLQHRTDYSSDIAVSPDGTTVFVAGTSYGGGCGNFVTVAYDREDGSERWGTLYRGAPHGCDDVAGIAVSGDGERVFVTGTSSQSDAGDIVTVAYDATDGSELWIAREVQPEDGYDTSAGITTIGNDVFVAGTVNISCDYVIDLCLYNMLVASYDGATGTRRWTDRYQGPGDSALARAIAPSIDGTSVYVTGTGAGSRFETVAYDAANGSRRWVAHSEEAHFPVSMAVSSDGASLFVAGASSSYRYALVALATADGTPLWTVNKGSTNTWAPYIDVDPVADVVYLAGEVDNHWRVFALDAESGSTLWRRRYANSGNGWDTLTAIAAADDGTQVFVTGSAQRRGSYASSYVTLALDAADGEVSWLQRYGGRLGGDHYAFAIEISPQGDAVYVTGRSQGPTGWDDIATISYDSG
jgi:DNA-binding beta-propeller fold protein YncE